MFKKVDAKQSFPKMEEEILKFWEENEIFEKSVQKNPEEKSFIFYEGPPTANGTPGLHHVLARAFKDVIPRYKTMKGFRVERKAGWDTHGLPVEIQVEKELGLKNKQDIENIVPGNVRESIIEFNKKCKESVWTYKDLWEKLTKRMAYWVDMKNPYVTYENKYIESVWWVISQIFETKNAKGESLMYKGHKVVPYCYRCGTALSSHEVAQGYQMVKENSITIKFKLKPGQKFGNGKYETKDSAYILAWTTTPWTLPGNVALAVGKDIQYTSLRIKGIEELLIVASELVEKIFKDKEVEIVHNDMFGKDLIGLEYEPLYETNKTNKKA
jgi:isoleucyl-tRNA synthetase